MLGRGFACGWCELATIGAFGILLLQLRLHLWRAFGCTLGVACLTLLGECQHTEAGNKDGGNHHFARVHGLAPFMFGA